MTSKLSQMQARFQQKQMQEKEEKLLKLYENQQQRAFDKVGRGSAGSNTSTGSTTGGKVRQMFDERRQKAGVDRSYPLEPLKQRNGTTGTVVSTRTSTVGTRTSTVGTRGSTIDKRNSTSTRVVAKSVVQKSVTQVKNGKPVVSKREVVQKIYNNNNGDEKFQENRFEFDDDKTDRNLVDIMNNENLDCLDNEEMPRLGFDETDDILQNGKLANLGGKLPSESLGMKRIVDDKKSPASRVSNGVLANSKKETKTVVKKPLRASPPAKTVSPLSASSENSRNSTPTSPTKNAMSQKPKAPNDTRPSARQGPKSGVVRDDLAECKFCGRSFATDRLDKHQEICGKSGKKKRRVYDSTKHRVTGTEMEGYVTKKVRSTISNKQSSKTVSKKDWRRTHEEFIATIRAAKQAQAYVAKGGKLADLPPPPPSSNPDYVQCPHCGRRFNEAAAARHIPKCANYDFNKPKPGQQKGRK